MNSVERKDLYDDIVFDYSSTKTNIFKTKYEKTEFWKAIGNIRGNPVLDVACGSGYYTRQFKQKGANAVVGVDISREMIAEANKCELEQPLGVKYYVNDASKYFHEYVFDSVTAQYLFCYDDTKEILFEFCNNVYRNTKPGGRLFTITTVLDENCNLQDMDLGYTFVPPSEKSDPTTLQDGVKVDVTLYSEDFKSKFCFSNFLWKLETISSQLYSSGFTSVRLLPTLAGVPVMIIIATKEN